MGALELQKKYGWDMVTITSEINSMSMNTPATDSIDILIKLLPQLVCFMPYTYQKSKSDSVADPE